MSTSNRKLRVSIVILLFVTVLFEFHAFTDIFNVQNMSIPFTKHDSIRSQTKSQSVPSSTFDKFASEAAFCDLTSSFSTSKENEIKQRIYDTIRSSQFVSNPSTDCRHKTLWISSMNWKSGLGWKLHEIALGLLTAVSLNDTIFMWAQNYNEWPFRNSPYCQDMECYFEPITNCKFKHFPTEIVNDLQYRKVNTLYITEELRSFWNPILEINDSTNPSSNFVSHQSKEYTILVMIAQWFLLRYNERTKSIITQNIKETLAMMNVEDRESPNPNQMMSIPIRHSDKCYDWTYSNAGAEMLCFESDHILKITKHIQLLYEDDDIKYGIVNSEDSQIVQQVIDSKERTFGVLTNPNDIRPETGKPSEWTHGQSKRNQKKQELKTKVENDLMTSMLTAAQLSTIPKYWFYAFSSNWFFYLSHFRNVLKCWPSNMDKGGDVQIELKSHCKRCFEPLEQGQRFVIYKQLKRDIKTMDLIPRMLDADCIEWEQIRDEERGKYQVQCQLTDRL